MICPSVNFCHPFAKRLLSFPIRTLNADPDSHGGSVVCQRNVCQRNVTLSKNQRLGMGTRPASWMFTDLVLCWIFLRPLGDGGADDDQVLFATSTASDKQQLVPGVLELHIVCCNSRRYLVGSLDVDIGLSLR